MNPENLIPNSQRTPSELRQQTHNAGVKSGEARRKKKAMKEATLDFLESPMNDTWKEFIGNDETGVKLNLDALDDNMQAPFVASLYKAAVLDRNPKAMELLLAIIGEKPAEEKKVEVKADENYKKIASSIITDDVKDDDTL